MDDHVSKLEHMGKETVKKLQDIHGSALQCGIELSVPTNCINKGEARTNTLAVDAHAGILCPSVCVTRQHHDGSIDGAFAAVPATEMWPSTVSAFRRQCGPIAVRKHVHNSKLTGTRAVGEFRKLAMLADADGHLRQKLQQVLKLSKEKFDDARDHAMRAVVADNRMRIWYVDKSNMEVGLLFTCRLGNVDLERPVGALRISLLYVLQHWK